MPRTGWSAQIDLAAHWTFINGRQTKTKHFNKMIKVSNAPHIHILPKNKQAVLTKKFDEKKGPLLSLENIRLD